MGQARRWLDQTFRLLDPISRRMMGLRSDMTAQIARISGTRLAGRPRPLRLAYGGDVMRVVPDVLNPERQLVQAGAEIIGRDDPAGVVEIILAGVLGLQKAGIKDVTLDLGLPHLAEVLIGKELAVMEAGLKQQLFEAIANRDISALTALPISAAAKLAEVMTASGASTDGLRALCADLDKERSCQAGKPADCCGYFNRAIARCGGDTGSAGYAGVWLSYLYQLFVICQGLARGDCQGRCVSHWL